MVNMSDQTLDNLRHQLHAMSYNEVAVPRRQDGPTQPPRRTTMSQFIKRIHSRRAFKLAAAGLLALSLSACSGGSAGDMPLGDSAEGEGGNLVVPVNRSPWLPAYKTLVQQYHEETGITVELREFPYEEMRTQQINDVQNGTDIFDVYQLDEVYMAEFFVNDWVQPFTDIDPDFSLAKEVNSYGDFSYWDADREISSAETGELIAAPLNGNVHLLMYRADLYDQLGLEVPTTWDEAIANGKAAQEANTSEYGYTMRTQGVSSGAAITYDFLPLLYSYGASWFVDEGEDWTPQINTPEAVAAATTLRELAELGPAATTTLGQAEVIAAMQSGQTLQVHVVAAAAQQLESEGDSNVVGKVGYAVMPSGPDGEQGVASGTWALTVPSGLDAERAERALDFISWVESKDVQIEFAKLGGIPTRSDALQADGFSDAQKKYFGAVSDEMPNVRPHVRYWFAPQMLEVTERILPQIAAGSLSPEDGMAQMQEDLTAVMRKTDLPMSE